MTSLKNFSSGFIGVVSKVLSKQKNESNSIISVKVVVERPGGLSDKTMEIQCLTERGAENIKKGYEVFNHYNLEL